MDDPDDAFPKWRPESLQLIRGRVFLLQWWMKTLSSSSYVIALVETGNPSYARETSHLKKVIENLLSDLSSVRNDLENGCKRRDKYPFPGFTKADLASLGYNYQDHVEQLDHASGYHIWQAMSLNDKVTANTRPSQSSVSELLDRWSRLKAEFDTLQESDRPYYIYGRLVQLDQSDRQRRARTLYEQLDQLDTDFWLNLSAITEHRPMGDSISQTLKELRNILEQTQDASIRNKERSRRGEGGRSPEDQDRNSESISERHDRSRKHQRKSAPQDSREDRRDSSREGESEPRFEKKRYRDYGYDLRRRRGYRDGDWTDTEDSYHGGVSRGVKARWWDWRQWFTRTSYVETRR